MHHEKYFADHRSIRACEINERSTESWFNRET
jgi:hypothetical protein